MAADSSNIVLGKIVCLFDLEYPKGGFKAAAAAPVVLNEGRPRVDPSGAVVSVKLDGACCMILNGEPMQRRDLKAGKEPPAGWIQTAEDSVGGHVIGFMPMDDKHMLSAVNKADKTIRILKSDGTTHWVNWANLNGLTLEFLGPKSQGNPYGLAEHCFYIHGTFLVSEDVPLSDYSTLKAWFESKPTPFEGIVIRLPDESLYKITRAHFGLEWKRPGVIYPLTFW